MTEKLIPGVAKDMTLMKTRRVRRWVLVPLALVLAAVLTVFGILFTRSEAQQPAMDAYLAQAFTSEAAGLSERADEFLWEPDAEQHAVQVLRQGRLFERRHGTLWVVLSGSGERRTVYSGHIDAHLTKAGGEWQVDDVAEFGWIERYREIAE